MEEDVPESVEVSEAGRSGDCFREEDHLEHQESCQHERFEPDDPRPSGVMSNESEMSRSHQQAPVERKRRRTCPQTKGARKGPQVMLSVQIPNAVPRFLGGYISFM